MKTIVVIATSIVLVLAATGRAQGPTPAAQIAAALDELSPHVASQTEREDLRGMVGRQLREQILAANRASSAAWSAIQTREDWERLRREKIDALRSSLGDLPPRPPKPPALVTARIKGDGFEIHNMVFQSRPGLVVTANLYVPDPQRDSMPGIVLVHSHHNPKEQGELQDMGMTWARAGCYVLVPDQLGHGERRQHPFISEANFPAAFQASRQDYYFRYDTSLQLYLAGQTLMGWMAHDLMTGVDLLLAQPATDPKRIILLGSVAGGGDPAGVTAALDERIACVVPFNFGGPQPETRYPLPDDAETSFNYSGGGSWESTRNLYRSAAAGFLPWMIVGSVAPRHLIHAHEFAWDRDRDPVWKRYQKIWGLYNVTDRLAFAHGFGTLTGQDPPGSHCNNIGAVHRRQIHDGLARWFDIRVRPDDEYSQRRTRAELTCLTDEARRQFRPQSLHAILSDTAKERLAPARQSFANNSAERQREIMRQQWAHLLAHIEPPASFEVREGSPHLETVRSLNVTRELVQSEPGVVVPVMTLAVQQPADDDDHKRPLAIIIAAGGIADSLRLHRVKIEAGLKAGYLLVLAEPRGAADGTDRGQQSAATSRSAAALMLSRTMLGDQLRDLRCVWRHIRKRGDVAPQQATVIGWSNVKPLPAEAIVKHPRRIEGRPAECQPNPALLALLLALFEDDVQRVDCRGGLVSYRSVLESPFVQVPHESIVPGVLAGGDLPELLAALAPREVVLSALVDGQGRLVRRSAARFSYEVTMRAYAEQKALDRLRLVDLADDN
jgi:dienelactone hydrolase